MGRQYSGPKEVPKVIMVKKIISSLALFIVILLIFVPRYYTEQDLMQANIPPIFTTKIANNNYNVFIHKDLYPLIINNKGHIINMPKKIIDNKLNKKHIYYTNGRKLIIDYSEIKDFKKIDYGSINIYLDGKKLTKNKIILNRKHIFGTDQLGRDIFSRTIKGIRVSVIVGICSAIVSLIIGVTYGGISGYQGGKIDNIMMSILNIVNSIPLLLIVILLSILIKPNMISIIMTIGMVYWVGLARQVRVQVMVLKERDFILAEKIMGIPKRIVIYKHIIPDILEIIVIMTIVNMQNAIFTESFLSFLGLGLPEPSISLGTLINAAMSTIRTNPYQLIFPSIAIILILICLNKISNMIISRNIN